jgi:hypothetical protein
MIARARMVALAEALYALNYAEMMKAARHISDTLNAVGEHGDDVIARTLSEMADEILTEDAKGGDA